MEKIPNRYKIIIAGEAGVGKSSLIKRYMDDIYNKNSKHLPTIGVDFRIKTKGQYTFELWDTAGQETFSCLISSYFRNTDGVILVYEITNRNSFLKIHRWLDRVRSNSKTNLPIIVIGNKSDYKTREVETLEAEEFCEERKVGFLETSAKNKQNVVLCFETLFDTIIKNNTNNIENLNTPDKLQSFYLEKYKSNINCCY